MHAFHHVLYLPASLSSPVFSHELVPPRLSRFCERRKPLGEGGKLGDGWFSLWWLIRTALQRPRVRPSVSRRVLRGRALGRPLPSGTGMRTLSLIRRTASLVSNSARSSSIFMRVPNRCRRSRGPSSDVSPHNFGAVSRSAENA